MWTGLREIFTKKNVKTSLFTPRYSFRNVILSIALGFGVGIVVLSIFYGPSAAFTLLGELFTQDFSSESNGFMMMLNKATILGFAGLAVMVGIFTGFLNIGVSGQMTFGGFLAYAFVNKMSFGSHVSPGTIVVVALLITTLGAMALALAAGVLKAYFKVNEVISTIMLNWIIVYLLRFVAQHYAGDTSAEWFVPNGSEDALGLRSGAQVYTDFAGSNVPLLAGMGVLLFVSSCVMLWFVFRKTRFGFKMGTVGTNRHAARYAGYNTPRMIIYAFCLSGFFAGLAAFVAFFLSANQIPAKTQPIEEGFLGIVISLVALNNPLGAIASALLFGVLDGPVGGIVTFTGINPNAVSIFAGVVSYFVAIVLIWQYFRPWLYVRRKYNAWRAWRGKRQAQERGESWT